MPFDFQANYDELNADDHDYRFYAAVARDLGVSSVLDLGCGTGTLARLMAADGIAVVAIDPDPEMLRVARSKPGADGVDWRLGYVDVADPSFADLAVMSGHVAQVFVDSESWKQVLEELHRAVKPGGVLAFESRNPAARGWERWTREASLHIIDTAAGQVEFWHQTVEVELPRVVFDTCTRNLVTGEQGRNRNVLAFRGADELRTTLERAGFEVTSTFGDWSGDPYRDGSPEIITIARTT